MLAYLDRTYCLVHGIVSDCELQSVCVACMAYGICTFTKLGGVMLLIIAPPAVSITRVEYRTKRLSRRVCFPYPLSL